jgi:hypothetical protein
MAAAAATAESAVPQHVLFGWPRLKMGVAAGTPQSVCPDYMGRADYHGHAVNMAARCGGLVDRVLSCSILHRTAPHLYRIAL